MTKEKYETQFALPPKIAEITLILDTYCGVCVRFLPETVHSTENPRYFREAAAESFFFLGSFWVRSALFFVRLK